LFIFFYKFRLSSAIFTTGKELLIRSRIGSNELGIKAAAIAKWIEKDLSVTVRVRKLRSDPDDTKAVCGRSVHRRRVQYVDVVHAEPSRAPAILAGSWFFISWLSSSLTLFWNLMKLFWINMEQNTSKSQVLMSYFVTSWIS